MVTEPEATSIYMLKTMETSELGKGTAVGDCFVLCNAGGSTIDLTSYRVQTVAPSLQIEEIAVESSTECGSSYIDRCFLKWLESKLGTENYMKISCYAITHESKLKRLIRDFRTWKECFAGEDGDVDMYLPRPLQDLDDEDKGIFDGIITITRYIGSNHSSD
jgi:hypothetical protein